MRKTNSIKPKLTLRLLTAAALIFAGAMVPGHANAIDCATATAGDDFDYDGYNDLEECEGLSTTDGAFLNFPGRNDGVARALRLDPDTPDLFFILIRATGCPAPVDAACTPLFDTDGNSANGNDNNIPLQADYGTYYDPLEMVYTPQALGGLEIFTHEVLPAQAGPDREITLTQKAVRVTESLDVAGLTLGEAWYGTPNDLGIATVYTQRIINNIDDICIGAVDRCADESDGLGNFDSRPELYYTYMMHTIAHELGHMLELAGIYNRRFGGYHLKAGTGYLMDQFVKYSSKGGGKQITFSITTEYSDPSQQGFHFF